MTPSTSLANLVLRQQSLWHTYNALSTRIDVINAFYLILQQPCTFEYHEPHFIEEMEMEEGEITSPKFQSESYINPRIKTPRPIFNQNPCSLQHDALLLCVLSYFSHV